MRLLHRRCTAYSHPDTSLWYGVYANGLIMRDQLVVSLLELQVSFDQKSSAAGAVITGKSVRNAQIDRQITSIVRQGSRFFSLEHSKQLELSIPEQFDPQLPDHDV